MTRHLHPTRSPAAALTDAELDRLARISDEEQRSVAYRGLLARHGLPDHVTDLSIAENALLYDLLAGELFEPLPHPLPQRQTRYVSQANERGLTQNVAARLSHSFGVHIEAADVYATAGVSAALESIALALQLVLPPRAGAAVPAQRKRPLPAPVPRGSAVLIPAPFWQGFAWSFGQVPGLNWVPVPVYKADTGTFELAVADLERAYAAQAEPPRLLVLTNPHNPLGLNYDHALLTEIYTWAAGKSPDMHVISDEIYRHSQLEGCGPGWVSGLRVAAELDLTDRVHVVWGFAKDFGLSGFRTGFIISTSPQVRYAMSDGDDELERRRRLSWFSQFDSLKHFYLDPLASVEGPVWDRVMRAYPSRLTASFNAVRSVLDEYGIRYARTHANANCAQFFWLDLREFLGTVPVAGDPTSVLFGRGTGTDAEQDLAAHLHDHARVKLLTGATMYQLDPPGFYRLCFTAFDLDTVRTAVIRLCQSLDALRHK